VKKMTANQASHPDALLIIIARAPIPGETKTRLGETIGMDRAAYLHRAFITDLHNRFGSQSDFAFAWSFTPAEFDFAGLLASMDDVCQPATPTLIPQPEAPFAERLDWLFCWAVDHCYRRTLIMASDSPHLPVSTLSAGFDLLSTNDVVLGRVADGGYYVIGMSGVFDVLDQAVMSTDRAADGLVQASRQLGLRVAEMHPSFDIDTESDLGLLVATLTADPALAPATSTALINLHLLAPDGLAFEHEVIQTGG
jgi:glycosyltransferase A (GT-A) superfamily protein (DUF2064 family)